MPPGDAVLELVSVQKTYGEGATAVRAVKQADLALKRGQLVLIMGPSGSGKTTLLSLMGCLTRPSSGVIRVVGREVQALPETQLPQIRSGNFGFVFQDFNLFAELTTRENVTLALDIAGRPERADGVPSLLSRLGIGDKLDRKVRELSGGQKQRVAIARALVTEPPILLCDEPTAALDTETGLSIMTLLRKVAEDGCGVAVVSHDPRLTQFADRLFHMRDGVLMEAA